MLSIRANAYLFARAEKWLQRFPEHDAAPRLAGSWLARSDSDKAAECAEHYLKQGLRCENLHTIIQVVFKTRCRESLWLEINRLMDLHPKHILWNRCIWFGKVAVNNERLEALALRWINVNIRNPDLNISGLIFSNSEELVGKAFHWIRHAGLRSNCLPHDLAGLLRRTKLFRKSLAEEVIKFAREWTDDNPDKDHAGLVFGALLRTTGSELDIRRGKEWYQQYQSTKRSWIFINELLEFALQNKLPPDSYADDQAKLLLEEQLPKERMRRLLETLNRINKQSD